MGKRNVDPADLEALLRKGRERDELLRLMGGLGRQEHNRRVVAEDRIATRHSAETKRAESARQGRTAAARERAEVHRSEIERLALRRNDWGEWVFGARAIWERLREQHASAEVPFPGLLTVEDIVKAARGTSKTRRRTRGSKGRSTL
jgi:hypothetical protein